MSTCAVCGAALDREWTLRLARKCRPDTPCWRARRRESSRKYRAARLDHERAYSRAYRAEVRAHRYSRRLIRARALERAALAHVGALAVAAWQAVQRAAADRAIARNRDATDAARAYAKARIAHSDERVVKTTSARDILIGQALADVRAGRQTEWDALTDDDRIQL